MEEKTNKDWEAEKDWFLLSHSITWELEHDMPMSSVELYQPPDYEIEIKIEEFQGVEHGSDSSITNNGIPNETGLTTKEIPLLSTKTDNLVGSTMAAEDIGMY